MIFVKFAVFVLLLSLILKGDDDKTYEDVNHEESNNDNEDEIEDSDRGSSVIYGAFTLLVGIYGYVEQSEKSKIHE